MAKKLSSRELAVKAKKKAAVAPKVSSRAVASKSPLVGAGPLMTGQARVGATAPAIGPMLQGQTRASSPSSSSSSSSSRDLASKAQKSKSSSLLSKASDLAGSAGAALRKVPGLKQIGEYGDDYVNTGNKSSLGKVMAPFVAGAAIPAGMFAAGAGAAGSGMASLAGVGRGVMGRGIGSLGRGVKNTMGEIAEGAATRLPVSALPTVGATAGGMAAGQLIGSASSLDPVNDKDSYNPDQEMFSGNDPITTDIGRGDGGNDNKKQDEPWVNPWGDVDISGESSPVAQPMTQDEITQQNNDLYGGGSMTDTPFGTQGNRSGRGSGQFGTGKGVQSDDPYIKELRKAYSSNGGEKWLRKQFEELISALDPTYAQMQKEGTDALNAQLNTNQNQLTSVMNAGNVGDSEQRSQKLAELQGGNQTALGNLLAKLSQAKAGDISQYKSQMAGKMSEYQQNQQTNAQKLQEAIRNYKNDKYDQEYKNASLNQKGSGTKANYKQVGVNSKGQPVYRDFNTGEQWVGEGLTPAMSSTPQLQQDENGNWFYEQ